MIRSWQTKLLKSKPKTTHVPLWKCTGCGFKRPQSDLLRLGKLEDGLFVIGEAPYTGRGAYFASRQNASKRFHNFTSCPYVVNRQEFGRL